MGIEVPKTGRLVQVGQQRNGRGNGADGKRQHGHRQQALQGAAG